MNEIDSLVCAEFKRLEKKESMPRKKTSTHAAFRAALLSKYYLLQSDKTIHPGRTLFMKCLLCSLILMCLVLCVCTNSSNPTKYNDSTKPGIFSLELTKGLSKSVFAGTSTSAIDSIKGSRSYYFLLTNIGNKSITDIQLHINGKGFYISPNSIPELKPTNLIVNEGSLIPIVRMDVVHGFVLNGTGWGGLLQQGNNACTLSVTGKTQTLQNRDTVVSLTKELNVFAYVANLSAFAGGSELNLDFAHACISGGDQMWGPCFQNDTLKLKNTGNVNLIITVDTFYVQRLLVPNDSLLIINSDTSVTYHAIIWPSNTISDIYTFPQFFDGRIEKLFVRN